MGIQCSGNFIRATKIGQEMKYLFQCKLCHRFYLKNQDIENGKSWCKYCYKAFMKIIKFALFNDGFVLQDKLDINVKLMCKSNHQWETNYKKATSIWCKICNKNKREEI